MSGFSSDWLALREPADHRSRRHDLLDELASPVEGTARRIVDLGTGTGSNLRYLLPRLGARQHWCLIDNDPGLLADLPDRLQTWSATHGLTMTRSRSGLDIEGDGVSADVRTRALDLAGDLDALALRAGDLVTCSALLDLFPTDRLEALADALAGSRCSALFALSYDGRVDWSPALPYDARSNALLNAHQRRDKGLAGAGGAGGSAGPDAGATMAALLRRRGYRVVTREADWRLDGEQGPLQRALVDGWVEALCEQAPEQRRAVLDWQRARTALIDAGESRLRVGHLDIVAIPG